MMPLDIFPYQEVGGHFLATRERAGLFDEMGIGKTAQAIRALDLRRAMRGIVVAPAGIRENWRMEFKKFAHIERRICKGISIHDFVAWQRGRFDVLVTSFEMATKWAPLIEQGGEILDFAIIDEGHFLKNPETQRSRAMLGEDLISGIMGWAAQAWWLTGTPIPNDPVDCYTFARFCRATPLTKVQFMKRYFHTRQKTYGSESKVRDDMIDELRRVIYNNAMRRTLDDVGLELPPIFLTSTVLDGNTAEVAALLKDHPGLEDAIAAALEQGGLSFIDAQHVSTLRRLIGEAKALPYAALLLDELRTGKDKAVVFGTHRRALCDVRDYLMRNGVRTVMITGETSERERIANMEAFQKDPNTRVMIGNIRAAGVGLTMTAACSLDMLESDWTPAGNAQAIKRVHRIGQTRSVQARFITLANSFDEVVNAIVQRKTAEIAKIEGTAMNAAPAPIDPVLALL